MVTSVGSSTAVRTSWRCEFAYLSCVASACVSARSVAERNFRAHAAMCFSLTAHMYSRRMIGHRFAQIDM